METVQASPGKKAFELLKDADVKATVNYDWKSGAWTELRLEIRSIKTGSGASKAKRGRGESEPKQPNIFFDEKEANPGKASIPAVRLRARRSGLMICEWRS